jgi:hypothetical protein
MNVRRLLVGHLGQSFEDSGDLFIGKPAIAAAPGDRDLDPETGIDGDARHMRDRILEGARQHFLDRARHMRGRLRHLCQSPADLLGREREDGNESETRDDVPGRGLLVAARRLGGEVGPMVFEVVGQESGDRAQGVALGEEPTQGVRNFIGGNELRRTLVERGGEARRAAAPSGLGVNPRGRARQARPGSKRSSRSWRARSRKRTSRIVRHRR